MTIVPEYDFEANTLTHHATRAAFRATVAGVAARAKERLPQAVNGRIESAVRLVLLHDVTPQADGSILVGSSTDALKTYRLVGTTCECQDFTRGQAPDGWCQHRISAGIHKRVQELLAAPVPVDPEILEPFPDNDDDPEEPAAPVPCPAPLPEAPCSVNCHIVVGGRQVQVTLRGVSEDEVLTRLERVLQRYPVPEAPVQASSQGQGEGFCQRHQVRMRWNEGKNGTQGWWSHKVDGQWCKGRK